MQFATAQAVKKPTQVSVIIASLYLALFFVAAVVLQLFAFESYPEVIEGYDIPGIEGYGLVVASIVVCLEFFALPYLLWMKVSRLMRMTSLVCGCIALTYWLGIGVWQSIVDFSITNAGLFGAKVMLPQGWWLVSYCIALLILMGYTIWMQSIAKPRK